MKLFNCLIVLLMFVKLLFFLRIFETFSFLVSMLRDVFINLSPFMAFFMMAVVIFSCLIQILLPETKANYEGTGPFSYIMMAFRTSIGDYTFDNYKATVMKELTWIVWLTLMIIGNVVFMNFIIAVVNESYTNSMNEQVSQNYRLKVQMIKECEESIRKENVYKNVNAQKKLEFDQLK
jgi:Ion transport protein